LTHALHERARRIRERGLILKWEYRQRHHAKGTWFRLRRALVDAREAWVISGEEADRLAAEGLVPLAVGAELEPPKRIFVVSPDRLATLASRRRIAVALNAEFLEARALALVPFTELDSVPDSGRS
jgi:hypothetical protein